MYSVVHSTVDMVGYCFCSTYISLDYVHWQGHILATLNMWRLTTHRIHLDPDNRDMKPKGPSVEVVDGRECSPCHPVHPVRADWLPYAQSRSSERKERSEERDCSLLSGVTLSLLLAFDIRRRWRRSEDDVSLHVQPRPDPVFLFLPTWETLCMYRFAGF